MTQSCRIAEVAVLMGSDSDWAGLEPAVRTLKEFEVPVEVRVMSAHRAPQRVAEYAHTAAERGLKVIIAAAGGAAHLAGVVAAHTTLPVIGVPMKGGFLDGLDALLATVQMPAGIPVATMAAGSAGPINAAILAVMILALNRPDLKDKLRLHKTALFEKVDRADSKIQEQLEK